NLRAGQKVMIYGASGSVGTYAVQLAKYYETEVTGVCSTANLELVKSLGADEVIDYTREDLSQAAGTYDVVFDAVGKLSPRLGKKLLKGEGTYLSVQSSTKENPQNLVKLGQLMDAGKLKPVIDRSYPFEQIPDAHRYVEKGHKKGNVAITVRDSSL
ncbi:MAG: NAD(P)-dependent alcohol dehydrogenase, partial [Anaerolineales bacterium]|nr:NAD(P)-dependent alcohol dehydrogenase [Anaerolineales bacterium]